MENNNNTKPPRISPLPWVMRFSSFPPVKNPKALENRISQTEPENTPLPASPISALHNFTQNNKKVNSSSSSTTNLISFSHNNQVHHSLINNQSKHNRTTPKHVKMSSSASSADFNQSGGFHHPTHKFF